MAKKLDFKSMTENELIENYINFKSNLFGLKFQLSVGQLADTNELEKTKKNIARVLTEMTKRGIDANKVKIPVVKKEKKAKSKKIKAKKQEKKAEIKAEIKKEEKKPEVKKPAAAPAPKIAAELAKSSPKAPVAKKTPASKTAVPKAKKEGK